MENRIENLFGTSQGPVSPPSLSLHHLPKLIHLYYCIIPPDPLKGEALYSDRGQRRPCIVIEVNLTAQTAKVIPGTGTDNGWGYCIPAGKYSLGRNTYFHTHEPREVNLSTLSNWNGDVPLSEEDFRELISWRPSA